MESSVAYPRLADLVVGLLLFARYPSDQQLCGAAVSLLGQFGNALNNNASRLFSSAQISLHRELFQNVDRLQLGTWFEEFTTTSVRSGYQSLLDILVAAGLDRREDAVFSLARRIFIQASQRILLRIEFEFHGCFKYSLAMDKSKVIWLVQSKASSCICL